VPIQLWILDFDFRFNLAFDESLSTLGILELGHFLKDRTKIQKLEQSL